jgi:hypothetical protein
MPDNAKVPLLMRLKLSPSARENAALRRRVRALEAQVEAEKTRALGISEMIATVSNGEADLRIRGEFVKALAVVFGLELIDAGAENYYGMVLNPPADVPALAEIGPVMVTIQRLSGKTPAMALNDCRTFFDRRFKQVSADALEVGRTYLCLHPMAGWGIYEAVKPLDAARLMLISPDSDFETNAPEWYAELYELRDPLKPRPDRVPEEGRRVVLTMDTAATPPPPSIRNAFQRQERFLLERGTVGILTKRIHNGVYRWYFRPDEWSGNDRAVSFPDDGGEMPEWIEPAPD